MYPEIKCLDKGFVRLVDKMGSDSSVVQAARVSYGDGTKTVREDEALIRYLFSHEHGSPFELPVMQFHVKLPIFVERQWCRHRTFAYTSMNEISARYSEMKEEFYIPDRDRLQKQSKVNKQGSGDGIDEITKTQIVRSFEAQAKASYGLYQNHISEEVDLARELARANLPVNLYTQKYCRIDLRNIFHFLRLRMDSHAQYEIRVYADALAEIVKEHFPICYKAFEDYSLHAVKFSRMEMEILKTAVSEFDGFSNVPFADWLKITAEKDETMGKREQAEFLSKLGISKN